MAIILRGNKGTALTHSELDNNFRQFFYSASYSGTLMTLHTTASLDNQVEIPLPAPHGRDGYIQVKSGDAPSGSEVQATSSKSFLYDYHTSELRLTGSMMVRAQMTGSGGTALIVSGNQYITENLIVGGTVTAEEFITEKIATSYIYKSGSTKFGDTADDTHAFTGSLEIVGSITGSDIQIDNWGSVSSSLQIMTASIADLSASVSANYLLNTTDTFTGDLTVTGKINATEISTTYVTSSILYNSGSNIFGDSASDVHIFTGSIVTEQSITGSNILLTGLADNGSELTALTVDSSNNIGTTELGSTALLSNLTATTLELDDNQYLATTLSPSQLTFYNNSGTIVEGNALGDIKFYGRDDQVTLPGAYYVGNINVSAASDFGSALAEGKMIFGLRPYQSLAQQADLTNVLELAVSGSSMSSPMTFEDNLAIPGFADVSASLAALTSGTISINNDADNRVVTANGNSTLNGESNLTFDGTALTINGTILRDYTGAETDITGLTGGTQYGFILEGDEQGHVVIGLRENETSDSFSIISGDGDYYSDTTFDKLAFQVKSDGTTTIGGNAVVSGSLNVTGDVVAYSTSDERLKDNVELISQPIDKLKQINGVSFDWNDKSEHSGHDVGVIAQQVEAVLPELVRTKDDGYKAVRYEKLVALLIEAVKEQQLQIDELKSRL
jgi:hypothetical protein